MHFEKIPHRMTLAAFRENFPAGKITAPKKSGGDAGIPEDLKQQFLANFTEVTSAGELLYQLTFRNEILALLQLSLNGDFNEEGYTSLAAVAQEIIALAGKRGLGAPAGQSSLLAWKDLIQSPLPEAERSEDRFIRVLAAQWKNDSCTAELRYDWTWPGQLSLEYKEAIQ